MNSMVGQRIPSATFKTRQNGEFVDVTSEQLFNGRTVVVFSLPGAFPRHAHRLTCHASTS